MDPLPEPAQPRAVSAGESVRRCMVCNRPLHRQTMLLEETPDVPDPHVWAVCPDCYAAVRSEVSRAALRTPLRVRIAVGVVASQRSHPARYGILDDRYWDQLTDEGLNRLLIWVFAIAFAVHAIAFVLVAAYIAIAH